MYLNNFFVWHKKFGPAQNILGPVKGQGISDLPRKPEVYLFSNKEISCILLWQPFSSMQELNPRILQSQKTDRVGPTSYSSFDWTLP